MEIPLMVISKQQISKFCAARLWREVMFTTILLLKYYKNITELQQILKYP